MSRCLVAAVFLAACGSKSVAPKPQPAPDPSPSPSHELTRALDPVAWLVGDWHEDLGSGTSHWVAAGGTLYNVRFIADGWSVRIIDDGDGQSDTADGARRLIELGGGHYELEFPETELAANRVVFGSAGMTTWFGLAGDALTETHTIEIPPDPVEQRGELVGRDPRATSATSATFTYRRATDAPARALEEADRTFDLDTAERGVDGWVAWFAPNGVLWRGERVEGRAAIEQKLAPTLSTGQLRWLPIASRMHGDDLGFTVGTATWTANDASEPSWRGSYVTIWRKQPDGRWLVEYDTGRAAQPLR
jgi:ketosteroid isomerase-like protein